MDSEMSDPVEADTDGSICSIHVRNFFCHDNLQIDLNKNVNFVVGRNGSGKSAILTALVVGLGGRASATNRGNNLHSFIKKGANSASVEIKIRNSSEQAYKHDVYGDYITVERHLNASGGSSYKVKNAAGKVISTKFDEVNNIITAHDIQVDNPISVLNQDDARGFHAADAKRKFTLFRKATNLDRTEANYLSALDSCKMAKNIWTRKSEAIEDVKKEKIKLKAMHDRLQSRSEIIAQEKALENEYYWSEIAQLERDVRGIETKRQKQQDKIVKLEEKLKSLDASCGGKNGVIDTLKTQFEEQNNQRTLLEEQLKDLEGQVRAAQTALRNFQNTGNKHSDQIRREKRKATALELEIKNINDGDSQSQRSSLEKAAASAKKALDAVRARYSTAQHEFNQAQQNSAHCVGQWERARQATQRARSELSMSGRAGQHEFNQAQQNSAHCAGQWERARQATQRARSELIKLQQEQRSLQSRGNDELGVYGEEMVALCKAVEQAHQRGQFTKKPIGPVGAHLKVREKKWGGALEHVLGGALKSFLVNDDKDRILLFNLMNKIYGKRSKPSVTCSKFLSCQHDVSRHVARARPHVSALDSLVLGDPVVANFLIDSVGVERILMVPEHADAQRLSDRVENVPTNCARIVTLDATEYFPAPRYRSYGGSNRRACYLAVSNTERNSYGGSNRRACYLAVSNTERNSYGGSNWRACYLAVSNTERNQVAHTDCNYCSYGGSNRRACYLAVSNTERNSYGGSNWRACYLAVSNTERNQVAHTDCNYCSYGGSNRRACYLAVSNTERNSYGGSNWRACYLAVSNTERNQVAHTDCNYLQLRRLQPARLLPRRLQHGAEQVAHTDCNYRSYGGSNRRACYLAVSNTERNQVAHTDCNYRSYGGSNRRACYLAVSNTERNRLPQLRRLQPARLLPRRLQHGAEQVAHTDCNYRSYGGSNRRACYLAVSNTERNRQLLEDIKEAQAQLRELEAEEQELDATLKEAKQLEHVASRDLQKLLSEQHSREREEREARAALEQQQAPHQAAVLVEELTQSQAILERLNGQVEEWTQKEREQKRRIDELERQMKEVKKQFGEVQRTCGNLEEEIEQEHLKQERGVAERQTVQRRLKEDRATLQQMEATLEERQDVVRRKITEAEMLCPRVDNPRDTKTVQEEIAKTKSKLNAIRTDGRSKAEVAEELLRVSTKYNDTKSKLDRIQALVDQVLFPLPHTPTDGARPRWRRNCSGSPPSTTTPRASWTAYRPSWTRYCSLSLTHRRTEQGRGGGGTAQGLHQVQRHQEQAGPHTGPRGPGTVPSPSHTDGRSKAEVAEELLRVSTKYNDTKSKLDRIQALVDQVLFPLPHTPTDGARPRWRRNCSGSPPSTTTPRASWTAYRPSWTRYCSLSLTHRRTEQGRGGGGTAQGLHQVQRHQEQAGPHTGPRGPGTVPSPSHTDGRSKAEVAEELLRVSTKYNDTKSKLDRIQALVDQVLFPLPHTPTDGARPRWRRNCSGSPPSTTTPRASWTAYRPSWTRYCSLSLTHRRTEQGRGGGGTAQGLHQVQRHQEQAGPHTGPRGPGTVPSPSHTDGRSKAEVAEELLRVSTKYNDTKSKLDRIQALVDQVLFPLPHTPTDGARPRWRRNCSGSPPSTTTPRASWTAYRPSWTRYCSLSLTHRRTEQGRGGGGTAQGLHQVQRHQEQAGPHTGPRGPGTVPSPSHTDGRSKAEVAEELLRVSTKYNDTKSKLDRIQALVDQVLFPLPHTPTDGARPRWRRNCSGSPPSTTTPRASWTAYRPSWTRYCSLSLTHRRTEQGRGGGGTAQGLHQVQRHQEQAGPHTGPRGPGTVPSPSHTDGRSKAEVAEELLRVSTKYNDTKSKLDRIQALVDQVLFPLPHTPTDGARPRWRRNCSGSPPSTTTPRASWTAYRPSWTRYCSLSLTHRRTEQGRGGGGTAQGLHQVQRHQEQAGPHTGPRGPGTVPSPSHTDGRSKAEVAEELLRVSTKYNDTKSKLDRIQALVDQCTKSTEKHRHKSYQLQVCIARRVQFDFNAMLSVNGYSGNMNIDFPNAVLEMTCTGRESARRAASTASLSGGERSYSTVAFVMALWACVELPFYFLDEFDVFMDNVNRQRVMNILLDHALKNPSRQFVFLTPQDASSVKAGPQISIHVMADPRP
ncbi:uncharacterized protein LOC133518575 [Cydia pomonella]|uniref:uncharacterized protein LOC133518575 n=1 Tax=Cydia pomonella TaxID=82600 RepID=UPI002ADE831A|nr:uncharacterized protein LOC133518575 [Cydia pomonella]